ncbi:CNNM domain-containing protein, partial [Mycobacterium tuberculosis]
MVSLGGTLLWTVAIVVVYSVIVPLYLVIGELIPIKAVARNADSALLRLAPPLRYFYLILSPVVGMLLRVAQKCMNDPDIDPARGYGDAHTEADLRTLMKESHQRGYIDQTELTLVDNIFEFTDTTAREIMIPRMDMICLRAGLSLAANKTIAIQHMRTRYPVCEHDK